MFFTKFTAPCQFQASQTTKSTHTAWILSSIVPCAAMMQLIPALKDTLWGGCCQQKKKKEIDKEEERRMEQEEEEKDNGKVDDHNFMFLPLFSLQSFALKLKSKAKAINHNDATTPIHCAL